MLFVIVLLVYGTSPVVTNGDSFLVVPTAHSILSEGDLDVDEFLGAGTDGGIAYLDEGDDGHPLRGWDLPRDLPPGAHAFDYFPWMTAAVVVPLVALFEVPGLVGVDRYDVDALTRSGETGLLNLIGGSVLTAISVSVISTMAWWGSRVAEPRRRRVAVLVGLVVALGTPAWSTLSRALWSQTTAVLFLSLAFLLALRLGQRLADRDEPGRRLPLLLGAAAGLAYAARPTSAVVVAAFGLWLAVQSRRALLLYVTGGSAVAAVWVLVNVSTFGSVQPPYFSAGRAGLGPDTLEALAGNLVSPNRGLLVFSSVVLVSLAGLVVAVRRRTAVPRGLAITGGSIVLAHLVVVSGSGEDWYAGSAYGPRFMADLIPVLTMLALPAVELVAKGGASRLLRSTAVALALFSIVMHAPGAWSKPAQCWSVDPVAIDADPGRAWDWRDLQATRGLRVLLETGSPVEAALRRCDSA